MGETRSDRVGFIHAFATLPRHPQSVPVNALVPVKGTVLGDSADKGDACQARPEADGGGGADAGVRGVRLIRPTLPNDDTDGPLVELHCRYHVRVAYRIAFGGTFAIGRQDE